MEVFGKQMEVFVPELTKKWKVNGIKMEVWYNSIESATKTKKPANALITALCEHKTHKRKRTILFSAYNSLEFILYLLATSNLSAECTPFI